MIILVFSAPVAEMADVCTCEFGYSENVEIICRLLETSAEFECIEQFRSDGYAHEFRIYRARFLPKVLCDFWLACITSKTSGDNSNAHSFKSVSLKELTK